MGADKSQSFTTKDTEDTEDCGLLPELTRKNARLEGTGVKEIVTATQPLGYNAKCMPTVLRSGPYRFYFYSHEPNEPPHVHVDRDDLSAKFWLDPVALAGNFGFRASELTVLRQIVSRHQAQLLEAWNGYFGIRRG